MRHVFISRFGQENLDLDRRTKHCLPNGFGQEKMSHRGLPNRFGYNWKTAKIFLLRPVTFFVTIASWQEKHVHNVAYQMDLAKKKAKDLPSWFGYNLKIVKVFVFWNPSRLYLPNQVGQENRSQCRLPSGFGQEKPVANRLTNSVWQGTHGNKVDKLVIVKKYIFQTWFDHENETGPAKPPVTI